MDAPPYSAAAVEVLRLPAGATERDRVAVEEPLEIRIAGRPVAVTMRTPGHDEELALGFCLSEGLRPREARLPDDLAANTVEVDAPGFDPARLQRSFYTSSSCGVCGKGALEAVAVEAPRVESELRLPLRARRGAARPAARGAGGVRRDRRPARDRSLLRGRRAAVRARGRRPAQRAGQGVGWAFRQRLLPLAEHVLCVSGRLSFELVQKAAVAGCPVLVAVGAPSSLAVELAEDRGITLCGFVRGGGANVYTEAWRISADGGPARRRREHAVRLAEGARAVRGGDARGTRLAAARRSVRREDRRRSPRRLDSRSRRSTTGPRGPVAGVVAGLRARRTSVAVVVPVDMPLLTRRRRWSSSPGVPRRRGGAGAAHCRRVSRGARCRPFEPASAASATDAGRLDTARRRARRATAREREYSCRPR